MLGKQSNHSYNVLWPIYHVVHLGEESETLSDWGFIKNKIFPAHSARDLSTARSCV
jgi:hypothetical protein